MRTFTLFTVCVQPASVKLKVNIFLGLQVYNMRYAVGVCRVYSAPPYYFVRKSARGWGLRQINVMHKRGIVKRQKKTCIWRGLNHNQREKKRKVYIPIYSSLAWVWSWAFNSHWVYWDLKRVKTHRIIMCTVY